MPESFLVIVKCMTYNHHAYIEDAMNGFCMQKTSFPYLCIVMDDCSTDGEQEVIKNYVDEHFNTLSTEETDDYVLNLCQHKTNENCYFAVFYLKYNHWTAKKSKIPYYSRWQDKCKYIALCEGDDYWIDERKLQMQVDFLERNEEYGMCYTGFDVVSADKEPLEWKFAINNQEKSFSGDIFLVLLKGNFIQTMTVCYRRSIEAMSVYQSGPARMDWGVFLSLAWIAPCQFFSTKTSVYRRHNSGITISNHEWIDQRGKKIADYFFLLYLKERQANTSFLKDVNIKANMVKKFFRYSIDNQRFLNFAKNHFSLYLYYPFGILFHYLRKIKLFLID